MSQKTIEEAARELAAANAEAEPSISRIYWFPAPDQIRLVEVDEEAVTWEEDETILPIYFSPVPSIPYPSGLALIRPEDDRHKPLPDEWQTDWSEAMLVFERK